MKHRIEGLGTDWFLPGQKRRFATTTVATSELTSVLAGDGLTFRQGVAAINYDDDAKRVLQHFVDAGYGDTKMSEHIR